MKSIIVAFLISMVSGLVQANAWAPSKPIEIVVPFPPGGGSDTLGRVVSTIFKNHGWESYVVNRPGADTTIAANYVAAAKPDGHTVFLGGLGFLDANLASSDPPLGIAYNRKSFSEIAPLMTGSLVLLVNNDAPVKNYQEFKQYIRQNPSKFNLGFWNYHVTSVFTKWARLEKLPDPMIVPYKGTSPMMTDLIGGQIWFAFDSWASASTYLASNRVKVIAVANESGLDYVKKTWPSNAHSVAELVSLSKFHPEIGFFNYNALYGPAGMPAAVVAEINRVITKSIRQPQFQETFNTLKVSPVIGSPRDLENTHTELYNMFMNAKQR